MARSTPRAIKADRAPSPRPPTPTRAPKKPATPRAKASAQAATPRVKTPRTRQQQSPTASPAPPTVPATAPTAAPTTAASAVASTALPELSQQPSANHILSCLACSVFGSIAGCVGKFALDADYTVPIAATMTRGLSERHAFVFYIVRALLVGSMLFLNSIMLNFLVRAMKALGTAPATTIINGFSFCFSVRSCCLQFFMSSLDVVLTCLVFGIPTLQGILGKLIFGEVIALQWWFGVLVILSGVALMAPASAADSAHSTKDKAKKAQ